MKQDWKEKWRSEYIEKLKGGEHLKSLIDRMWDERQGRI